MMSEMNEQSVDVRSPQRPAAAAGFHKPVTPRGGVRLPLSPMAARRVAKGAKGHFSGLLVMGEDEGQAMEVESHTEMVVALVMLARPNVVGLENQVPFGWTDGTGFRRTHYFDFRVNLRDGSRTALIVKANKRLASEDFREETRRIASQVTPDFADRVCVMTEKHIDPIEAHNAELLHSVRRPDPEADSAARRALADVRGSVRVGDLVERTGFRGRGFRAVVRLIRGRELELSRQERIGHGALVRRRAA